MEVLTSYHFFGHVLGVYPLMNIYNYICGRYLQFRYLKLTQSVEWDGIRV